MSKALSKAGLQDALLKYDDPLTVENYPQYGINGDLMWLNRSPDIEEKTQGDVRYLYCAEY